VVHSPVTGQRVSRRRRGDEITQQVSTRVGQEAHFTNFHHPLLQLNTERPWLRFAVYSTASDHSCVASRRLFYKLLRSTSHDDSSDQRLRQTAQSPRISAQPPLERQHASLRIWMPACRIKSSNLTDSITRPDAGGAYHTSGNRSAPKKRSGYHFGNRGTAGPRIAKTLPHSHRITKQT
jgi:hypothetical protein